jgi:hypothetical protein
MRGTPAKYNRGLIIVGRQLRESKAKSCPQNRLNAAQTIVGSCQGTSELPAVSKESIGEMKGGSDIIGEFQGSNLYSPKVMGLGHSF